MRKNGTTRGSTIPIQEKKAVLYDFRQIDQFVKPAKFSRAEEKLVLDYAIGPVKREFAISGIVIQRLSGAFTAPEVRQTLYLARSGAESQIALVIFEGTKPLLKMKFAGQNILKVTDLDRDGRSELLITTGETWMSGRKLDAQLVQLNESGIDVIKTFKNVCTTADSDGHERTSGEVATISYLPSVRSGEFPEHYAIVRYKCRGAEGAIDSKTCRPR